MHKGYKYSGAHEMITKREKKLIKTSKIYMLLMYWPSHIMYQISGTGSHKRLPAKRLQALLIIPCPDNSST